jgi:hypothetical protein
MHWAIASAALIALPAAGCAQNGSLFDAERRNFRGSGWTFSAGYHGFAAQPDSLDALYQTVSTDGSLDTLHVGTWHHDGAGAIRLGVGYWGVAKRPLIWDRWSVELHGTRNAAVSTFDGWIADADSVLQPNQLIDSGRSVVTSELTFKLHRAFEIRTDFFVEVQIGLGWDREWGASFSRTGPDSLFVPRAAPPTDRLALELGAGIGVRTRSGRYLRVHAAYDGLQLAPFAEEGDGRVQWYEGQFQPWNLTVQWDLLRPKPLEDCAKPPARDRPGEVLFGEQMEKDRRKQKKKQKRRAKKQRKGW